LGYLSVAASVLLGASLMATGRREDILDGIAIMAGGSALTTLFLGLFHAAKKETARGAKLLAASVSLAAMAILSRGVSQSLEPSIPLPLERNSGGAIDAVYEKWFSANKGMIDGLKKMEAPGPALGAIQGMVVLEPHTLVRSAWYEHARFAGDPKSYGFDSLNGTNSTQPPVLLLPGAIGTWHYLGDLARALKRAGIPVFLVDVGAGGPTDEKLKKVREKIGEIRAQYANPPAVDVVAHSMGANLGVAAAYEEGVFFDADGNLKFPTSPKANPKVGKVIALANPLAKHEVSSLEQANKIDQAFNILAKYDGIMGDKQPALLDGLAHQVEEIDAGHVGIVFDPQAHQRIISRLYH